MFLRDPCRGVISKTTGVMQLVDKSSVGKAVKKSVVSWKSACEEKIRRVV
jgi:hypothetical protein